MLRRIESRGALEVAHRVKTVCGQIFRYAVATGRADRDPTADLKGALKPHKESHLAAITDPREVAPLLLAIVGDTGSAWQSDICISPRTLKSHVLQQPRFIISRSKENL
jgi:hypothetical protein